MRDIDIDRERVCERYGSRQRERECVRYIDIL